VPLWRKIEVPELGESDSSARELNSRWCGNCGTEFIEAILRGEQEREGLNTGPIKKWREDPPEEGTMSAAG
jgi:hypothetical protein